MEGKTGERLGKHSQRFKVLINPKRIFMVNNRKTCTDLHRKIDVFYDLESQFSLVLEEKFRTLNQNQDFFLTMANYSKE